MVCFLQERKHMKTEKQMLDWEKPAIEEIPLSCEVTSYSSAELPDNN